MFVCFCFVCRGLRICGWLIFAFVCECGVWEDFAVQQLVLSLLLSIARKDRVSNPYMI